GTHPQRQGGRRYRCLQRHRRGYRLRTRGARRLGGGGGPVGGQVRGPGAQGRGLRGTRGGGGRRGPRIGGGDGRADRREVRPAGRAGQQRGARALGPDLGVASGGLALRLRGQHDRPPQLRAGGAPADGEGGTHHQRLLRRRQARHPQGRRVLLDKVRPQRPLGLLAGRGRRSGRLRDERLPGHHPDFLQGQLPPHKGREAGLAPEGRNPRAGGEKDSRRRREGTARRVRDALRQALRRRGDAHAGPHGQGPPVLGRGL
ncbi:MAG: hypothetical protein AVDCRST_MAG12-3475, partial [uncultured Rubrobacteraceae bacterium]